MSEDGGDTRFKVWANRLGLALAAVFYAVSVVAALNNHGGMGAVFSGGTQIITFAHWQLEDGFREGFDEAIAEYERRKAAEGVKVKVRQVAIPVRGYSQWFLTQLIGGDPADVIELLGSSDIHNQYLVPLSPYIGRPNPWNRDTPLEGYSWRDSFVDDMLSAFDPTYSEFFGVCIFMHTTRVYANMDLYRKAAGDRPLPATVSEWLDACRLIREYGKATNRPLIPIGVRGFDKSTLSTLLTQYHSQMNADLLETSSPYGYGISTGNLYRQMNRGELPLEKVLAPVELVTEIGQYFAEGFPSIDLEQTKFLFSSGNVAFFIDGTWNAWSMVNNSPFPVEVTRIPVLDRGHPLGKHAFGEISELGSGVGGKFGIAKKTRHFDLALDFLQYITSYNVNRRTMVDHCKWMSSLKHVEYEGLMKTFEPISKTPYTPGTFTFNIGTYTMRKTLQWVERGIIRAGLDPAYDPAQTLWDDFLADRSMILDEQRESAIGIRRHLWTMDGTRSALAVGLADPGLAPERRALLEMRGEINLEGIVSRLRALDNQEMLIREIPRLKGGDVHGR